MQILHEKWWKNQDKNDTDTSGKFWWKRYYKYLVEVPLEKFVDVVCINIMKALVHKFGGSSTMKVWWRRYYKNLVEVPK